MKILETYNLNGIYLKNRIVMAPMTRSRALNNIFLLLNLFLKRIIFLMI